MRGVKLHVARTFAMAARSIDVAGDLAILTTEDVAHVYAIASGKLVGKLPQGFSVGEIAGTAALVHTPMQSDGDVAQWRIELWDLEAAKRVSTIARCTPEDKLGPCVLRDDDVIAVHTRIVRGKYRWQLVVLDRRGAEQLALPLSTTVLPFHLAAQRHVVAWAYFNGKGGLVDLAAKKQRSLTGGTLPIGRRHERGLGALAFDRTGSFVIGSSSGAKRTCVWNALTGKTVAGPWRDSPHACFVGDRVCCWSDGATLSASVLAGTTSTLATGAGAIVPMTDDRHVIALTRTGLAVWDVIAGKRVATLARTSIKRIATRGPWIVAGNDAGTAAIELA